jgi:hypothetical protein
MNVWQLERDAAHSNGLRFSFLLSLLLTQSLK